jgi:L-iditol 2-dehydrogenase
MVPPQDWRPATAHVKNWPGQGEEATMQAVRLTGVGQIGCAGVLRPRPGPGEVLVRVEAAGICGTDRHLFKGEFPSTPPVTLGHEFCGIVEIAGEGVTLAEGTRITCDPNIACGTCPACLEGRVNLCERLVAIGVHTDGGLAEYALIPAHRAFALPDGLDPAHGALAEPLACCIHGVDRGAPRAGDRVIVLGGGVIGLLTVQLCARAGAEVMLVTRHPDKRTLALTMGAAQTAESVAAARALWPRGAQLVMECAGVADTVVVAPRLAARGGRAVIVGVMPAGEQTAIEPFDLLFREVDVLTAFLNPFTQVRAAAMIAQGGLVLDPLISRMIPLAQAPAAIAAPPLPGDIKVMVRP